MSSQPTLSPPPSATATSTASPSPSPRRLASDDENPPPTSPAESDSPSRPPSPPPPPPPPSPKTPAFPSREDCWSEEATRTLIEAWGAQYLHLNRGNLRQKHWQEVADAVNAGHAAKLRRTDVQCKNRIDTTKKKYKIEKSKAVQSNGRYVSTWSHFDSLDALIGDSFSKTAIANGQNKNLRRRISPPSEISPSPSPSPEAMSGFRKITTVIHRRSKDPAVGPQLRLPWSVPVGPRSKRSGPGSVTERNFSVMAAAAAAMEAGQEDDNDHETDVKDEGCGTRFGRRRRRRLPPPADWKRKRTGLREGYRMLAAAIMRLGETYEKVEVAKQRQIVEFEKQRMQFAKDLELLRAQVQLDNLKRVKCTSLNKSYL